jgi:hypothetical protein
MESGGEYQFLRRAPDRPGIGEAGPAADRGTRWSAAGGPRLTGEELARSALLLAHPPAPHLGEISGGGGSGSA